MLYFIKNKIISQSFAIIPINGVVNVINFKVKDLLCSWEIRQCVPRLSVCAPPASVCPACQCVPRLPVCAPPASVCPACKCVETI